jgi:hypothetical protein
MDHSLQLSTFRNKGYLCPGVQVAPLSAKEIFVIIFKPVGATEKKLSWLDMDQADLFEMSRD